jgi:hypothetical protein
VVAQVLNHLLAYAFGLAVANLVDGGVLGYFIFLEFFELACGNLANGAFLGWFGTFVDITTYCAYKFLCHSFWIRD